MSSIQIINPLNIPNWDELILPLPGVSFFHSADWARVLSESYGYQPLYFTGWEGGELTVVIPIMEVASYLTGRRGVSLPFTDFCDPLIQEPREFPELLKTIQEVGRQRRWGFIEFRGGRELFHEESSSGTYYLHHLDLNGGPEKIHSQFKESNRRNIRKAGKEGLKAEVRSDLDSIKEFCRLNSLTRRDHGLPPQPFFFFKKIYDNVISRGRGLVVLADYRGEKVAGAVFFHFGQKAIYKYGASDKKFQSLRANNLLIWEAVRWFAEKDFQELHFGRTDLDHEGLRRFKNGWGTTETRIQYLRYNLKDQVFQAAADKKANLSERLFRLLPLPLADKLGTRLYRHAG